MSRSTAAVGKGNAKKAEDQGENLIRKPKDQISGLGLYLAGRMEEKQNVKKNTTSVRNSDPPTKRNKNLNTKSRRKIG